MLSRGGWTASAMPQRHTAGAMLLSPPTASRHVATTTTAPHGPATAAPSYRVAMSGSSGMIGTALTKALMVPSLANHHNPQVHALVRGEPERAGDIRFLPDDQYVDLDALEGCNAIVNLAGQGMGLRWTERGKHQLLHSRRAATELLANAILAMDERPEVVVSASGIGYYGYDLGDQIITESSPHGDGFLADLAEMWEESIAPVREAGVRVVTARIGVVMDPAGGALARMLPAFKMGGGGAVGSGDQYWSWISLKDTVAALMFALRTPTLDGPINVTSPNPVTNREFTTTLGKVLRRPTFVDVPEAVVKTVFGEMGDETLLASQRVMPKALLDAGFRFSLPEPEEALRHALGR